MDGKANLQSSIEYLIIYTIAILIVVLILTVLINVVFKPQPQQTLPSICNINPSFQCTGAILVNGTSTSNAIYYLEFVNKMNEPILLSSSAINLTSVGNAKSISTKGSCYPNLVAPGGQVICKVLINSSTVPSIGSKTTSTFSLSYHICSNLSSTSCSQTTYSTSGSSIQTVGPSKTTFYNIAINIEGLNSNGALVSTNGSILVNGVPYVNGQNVLITKSGTYKIYAAPPSGFNFSSWSILSPNSLISSLNSQTSELTINSNATLTAKFTKIVIVPYYKLNVIPLSNVGGVVAPSSGLYKAGSSVTLSASANKGYYFVKWIGNGLGSYTGTSNTETITINNNINETAIFDPYNPVYFTFNSESNPTMQSTGSNPIFDVAGALYTLSELPKNLIFAYNSTLIYKFESPIAGATSTQYVFNYIVPNSGCTTDGLTAQSGSFTALSNCIATANYTTQYYLTTSSYPSTYGTASPASEWVSYENTITISATPNSGYVFTGWQCTGTACYSGNNAIDSLTIYSPTTETATFNIPLAVSISPSSATLDQGQTITIVSSPSGGKPPYSYQWYEQAPSSNVEPAVNCANSIAQNCTFATNTAVVAGTYVYYITVTDQMDNTIKSTNSVITLNPPLSVSISPTSATYDSGQTITLAASVTGGTSPYYYQWYNDTSGSGVAISGATSSTYSVTSSATGTFKYYVVVTDSATTPT
ncbi:MAG: InlB B-repeat-containing protein, partial [Candidatus Micrarchaeia archaeon]